MSIEPEIESGREFGVIDIDIYMGDRVLGGTGIDESTVGKGMKSEMSRLRDIRPRTNGSTRRRRSFGAPPFVVDRGDRS